MHTHNLVSWRHPHQFASSDARNERNTTWVVLLTLLMMIVEIGAGMLFGSVALISYDRRFVFGTGKMCVLAGFSSAFMDELVHITIEVHQCSGDACTPVAQPLSV
jgi:hypothetical protein